VNAEDQPLAILVEDNLMFAMMVEPALKKLGYRVRILSAGAEAAARIAGEAPELVFVNLTTQRYPAPQLVREMRARDELAETPIVGYAGHVEREFFQAGRAAGATLVVPNSAIRAALPEVLEKVRSRLSGIAEGEDD